jgi:zinc protease
MIMISLHCERSETIQNSHGLLRRLCLLAMTISIFWTSSALAAGKLLDIQEVTSPDGIKAWLVEDHTVPVIAVNFAFTGAGSVLEGADKQGLARMLSNTLDEGAGNLDSQAFQKELQDLSISLSFGASRDDFSGSLKTTTLNSKRAFELLEMALTKPRFDAEPVERMRAANLSRVRSSLSDPDWIAARLMNDTAFAGHPYALNSGGTLTSLGKITVEDLKAFHKNYLGKNNLVVSVAGDMTKEQLAKLLDEVFGQLPDVKLPAPPAMLTQQNANTVTVYNKDIPQTIIEIMQPGIDRKDKDYQTAQVMNFILGSSGFGSRLTEEIREKRGLTYGIYSSYLDMKLFDGMGVSTSTENKNAGEIISLVKAEWKKIKDIPVTEKELKDAQTYLTGSIPLALTSTDAIAGLLLSLQVDGMPADYLEQREKAIKATTAADVQRVAKRILDENKFTVILVGKPEGIKDFKTVGTLPNAE